MISFVYPKALWALFAIIPTISYSVFFIKKITRSLGILYGTDDVSLKKYRSLRNSLYIRTLCFVCAWMSLVLALSGPSWGTSSVPVQKTGTAVSFVFDISHSMSAQDGHSRRQISRLESAALYASLILEKLQVSNVATPAISIVIAKGEGVVSLPFSEDYYSAVSFFKNLSPNLMTAPGSNLGAGLRTAVRSFPSNHARYSTIFLFTDGDETRMNLEEATDEALQYGINVVIIGFGSSEGKEILAGDNETFVQTRLQEETLKKVVSRLQKKYPLHKNSVQYVRAEDVGSASKILSMVNPLTESNGNKTFVSYEIQPIKRHTLFIFLSILFFIAGILFSECKPGIKKLTGIFLCVSLFFSCSVSFNDGAELLQGSFYWHRGNYQKATVSFLKVIESAKKRENEELLQYGLYNLATTYMKQNEQDSALKRLYSVSSSSPDYVLFAKYYNLGIIEYEKGNFTIAAEHFKQSLRINPSDLDSKINLELSLLQTSLERQSASQSLSPLAENKGSNTLQDTVFSIIRENEQNRWQNKQIQNTTETDIDY